MTQVVIMAGGFGTRLGEITKKIAKPMVHVGSKPLLREIIEGFAAQGFTQFHLTVHYRADQIESYFGNGADMGVSIAYVHEKEPLGTAGGLRLLPPLTQPFIISNADVLSHVDYADMLRFHKEHEALATMAVANHQEQVPYGVVESERDMLRYIKEKPVNNYPVAAGIYILEPEALKYLPRTGAVQMPDLLLRLKDAETDTLQGVACYPLVNSWYDVGTLSSLEQARARAA